MSILSKNNNMGTPSFHEFKKQASFFLKEKIKTARLVLTDVTPAQLLTEEATSGNPWAPDTVTLSSISKAAFELDDFWRIVEILHNRFSGFERKKWRVSYNSLIVLERLLTHGPESVFGEFQSDKDVIKEMEKFQFIDEKGFNWGLAVRKKSERILKLLEKETFLKAERDRARKLTRGIQGFGSFCERSSSSQCILQDSSSNGVFTRSNSQFTVHDDSQENSVQKVVVSQKKIENDAYERKENENLRSLNSFSNVQIFEKHEKGLKENMDPEKEDLHKWNFTGEAAANPFLDGNSNEPRIVEEDQHHPFTDSANQSTDSLLLTG